MIRISFLASRSMAGRFPLEKAIGVRFLRGQPKKTLMSIAEQDRERLERIRKICEHFDVTDFWSQNMSLDEIKYFEDLIAREPKENK